ncbi:hypothetical protein JL2886_01128 [Phaeobacter gallaeciensis]|uniref:Uncharacterized protein n=1 Tax=Phaeobacter gallaeciensis TaxID=60890 RepID=A0A1B0ZPF4_9RHOB|nr:hypothetical protein JL2886_01128 [Phaeobacter gallaeciensis]
MLVPGTDVSEAQKVTFTNSADLATWQAIRAAGALPRADLRRSCSRRPPSNGGDADFAAVQVVIR